ncbi:hypothetical protein ACFL5V_04570 [Fibrobacterota bacterium]
MFELIRFGFATAFLLLVCTACQEVKDIPDLGDPLPNNYISTNRMVHVDALKLKKAYELYVNGIEYLYAIDDKSRIMFMSTEDPLFTTVSGIKVGLTYNKVKEKVSSALKYEKGWAHYLESDSLSDWCIAFHSGSADSLTGHEQVKFFFKRIEEK